MALRKFSRVVGALLGALRGAFYPWETMMDLRIEAEARGREACRDPKFEGKT